VALRADGKATRKRPQEPGQAFRVQHFRKGVETTISSITERLPKSVHAVTAQGFALKRLLVVCTHTRAQREPLSETWVK
jgi:hypothetical protein